MRASSECGARPGDSEKLVSLIVAALSRANVAPERQGGIQGRYHLGRTRRCGSAEPDGPRELEPSSRCSRSELIFCLCNSNGRHRYIYPQMPTSNTNQDRSIDFHPATPPAGPHGEPSGPAGKTERGSRPESASGRCAHGRWTWRGWRQFGLHVGVGESLQTYDTTPNGKRTSTLARHLRHPHEPSV